MKWFLFLCLAILFASIGIFYKSITEVRRQLNIHSTADKSDSPLAQSAKVEYFQSSNNQRLAYWYFPVTNPKAVLILAHGFSNPGGKSQMIVHAQYLKKAGYTTIIPDLRSFGDSEGQRIYLGTKEWQDLVDTYNLVKSFPENKDKKIGYLGVSMGAASAITALSRSGKGDFIIASVPFESYDSLAEFRLKDNKYLPLIKPFIKLAGFAQFGFDYPKYSAINNIANVHVPIQIFSASQDEFVNYQNAKHLFDLANDPKEFWQANSPHDIYSHLPGDFEQHVLSFLAKIL